MQQSDSPSGLEASVLGKEVPYSEQYDPSQLFPLARLSKRSEINQGLGLDAHKAMPFMGADLWTAYELSWLNPKGKPQLALAHITVPAESPNIIESKSFKLYLGSFTQSRFDSAQAVRAALRQDLSEAAWRHSDQKGAVGVELVDVEQFGAQNIQELAGLNLDRLDIDCFEYKPNPSLLSADHSQAPVTETLSSRLLKSNCLITGQPDWGSVQISYSGAPIDQAGLLRYIVSFRQHNEFHEQCVERIFMDIWQCCKPIKLSVYARYTRRGGLDINPWRSSHPQVMPPNVRTARQ